MMPPIAYQRFRWSTRCRVLSILLLWTGLWCLLAGENTLAQESSTSKAGTNSAGTNVSEKANANSTTANSSAKAQVSSTRANSSKERGLTPVQIERAKEFASAHHAELGELLGRLEKYDEPSFVEAIQELLRTIERLEKLSEKNAERGRVELEDWKLTSRIRLLAARLAMADSLSAEDADSATDPAKSIKQEIRELLIERAELRKSTLAAERQRLQDRLDKVNRQLSELSERERQNIERELDRLEANASQAKTRQKAAQGEKSSQNAKQRPKLNAPKSGSAVNPAEKPENNKQKP